MHAAFASKPAPVVRSALAGSLRPAVRAPRCQYATQVRAMEPDNASILVCGGAGVGLHVTRKLKDMGAWVWMLQRTDNNRPEIEKMMAFCVRGDAMDQASITKAFDSIEELDAVVSTVGGSVQDASADGQGNLNIIEDAVRRGVKKFVLVTSLGCGASKAALKDEVYSVLKPVLIEKEKAEARLQELSDKMTFVIVRPGGLTNDPQDGPAFATESQEVCGAIDRKDVADLVCQALFSDAADNKILSAVDKSRMTSEVDYEVFQF